MCHVENVIAEEQAGFRQGRGTTDQIFVIRQIAEKYAEYNKAIYTITSWTLNKHLILSGKKDFGKYYVVLGPTSLAYHDTRDSLAYLKI